MTVVLQGSERFRGFAHRALRLAYAISVSGLEHLQEGRAILAVRHTGLFRHGGIVLAAMLPRPLIYVGAQFMLAVPVLSRVVAAYGGIFVGRGDMLHPGLIDEVERALGSGAVVGLMADGAETEHRDAAIKRGAVYLSARLGVPLCAAAVRFRALRSVEIQIHPPLEVLRSTDRGSLDAATTRMARLL